MGEMASLWGYEEFKNSQNHDMEQLGQKLLYTTLELEKLKSEAMEEMRKNKEYMKQLIHMLNHTIYERDQAKNQLHKLLNSTTILPTNNILLFQPDNHLVKPGKGNSSITESNSFSETFDAVSSHELSDINLVTNHHHQPFVQESNAVVPLNDYQVSSGPAPKVDQGSLIIDNLVKGKELPQRGKFLQAVIQAGPLLQTLLVAGPLPRWRNPPQFDHQPLMVPPVSMINGCDGAAVHQKMAQVHTAPMLSFGRLGSGSCLSSGSLITSGMNTGGGYVPLAKRQRFS